MTTPDTKMLSAERLALITHGLRLCRHASIDWARDTINEFLTHIDTLTTRVAELERAPEDGELLKQIERVLDEHSAWIARPSNDVTKAVALVAGIWGSRYADAANAKVAQLESELAAARAPVGDSEVAGYALRVRTIASHALDPGPARNDLHHAADLITRLARERDEARAALEKFAIVSVHRPAQNLSTVHVGYRCDLCDPDGDPAPRDQVVHATGCALSQVQRWRMTVTLDEMVETFIRSCEVPENIERVDVASGLRAVLDKHVREMVREAWDRGNEAKIAHLPFDANNYADRIIKSVKGE